MTGFHSKTIHEMIDEIGEKFFTLLIKCSFFLLYSPHETPSTPIRAARVCRVTLLFPFRSFFLFITRLEREPELYVDKSLFYLTPRKIPFV